MQLNDNAAQHHVLSFNHFNPTKMAAQESGHFTVANYG
jgi:hypothetical protein